MSTGITHFLHKFCFIFDDFVAKPVSNYTLGSYQVLKKWLSYRESALLGRPLTPDEAQHFTHHIRRITAVLDLHEKLDAHYGASV